MEVTNDEGMVAIVQALRDAGLSVTLTDGRYRSSSPVIEINRVSSPDRRRRSSEAQTHVGEFQRDSSAQISDGRYASSYQLAHCHVSPTSPPVRSKEFPQQKVRFCPYQGNFEIGGYSGDVSPVRDSDVYRSDITWLDKGNPHHRRTDPFVESLRKYPNFSPDRTPSADIIQKLLTYTQAKNMKSSRHSRSMRSLIKKSLETREAPDSKHSRTSSKDIQTYTRTKTESPKRESSASTNTDINKPSVHRSVVNTDANGVHKNLLHKPVANCEICKHAVYRSSVNGDNSKCGVYRPVVCSETVGRRRSALQSAKSCKNIRLKDSQVNTTYDYLKSPTRRISPTRMQPNPSRAAATEVHYLDDLSKYVRDTLKCIYEDQTIVCPQIAKRYSQHRKECPRYLQSSSDSVNSETQTPQMPRFTETGTMSHRFSSPRISLHSLPPTCCYCHKPLPCDCKQSSFHRSSFSKHPKSLLSPPTCKFNLYLGDEEKREEEFPCPCPSDEVDRKIYEQVFEWLKDIPVNADCSPVDRAVREEIAKDLIDRLKELQDDPDFEEPAKQEILRCLTYMPMWYPDKSVQESFRNQIADNLLDRLVVALRKPDQFGEKVAKWVQELPLKLTDNRGQLIVMDKVKEYVIDKIKPLALNRPTRDDEYKNVLKLEIRDVLEKIPLDIRNERTKDKVMNLFANKLIDELVMLPEISYEPKDKAERDVLKMLQDMSDFKSLNGINKMDVIQNLGKKLKELQTQGLNETEIQEEIGKALDDRLETISFKNILKEEIQGEIKDWIYDHPELSKLPKMKENQQEIKKLTNSLTELAVEGIDRDNVKSEIIDKTKVWLDTALKSVNSHVEPRRENKIADNLFEKLVPATKRAEKESKGLSNLKRGFHEDIKKWVSDIPEISDAFKNKEKQQPIKEFVKNLVEIQKHGIDDENVAEEIKEEVKTFLNTALEKEGAHITSIAKAKLTENLKNKLVDTAKKEGLYLDVKHWIDDISGIPDVSKKPEYQLDVQELTSKVEELQKEGLQDEDAVQDIKDETKKWLDFTSKKEGVHITPKDKTKLSENLVERLQDTEKTEDTKKEIKDWIKDIKELPNATVKKENQRSIKRLAEKLVDLQKQGLDDENVQANVKQETTKWLDSTLDDAGVHLNPAAKSKLTEKLLQRLTEAQKSGESLGHLEEQFKKEILDWMDDIHELTGASKKKEHQQPIKKLAQKLVKLKEQGLEDEDVKAEATDEIKHWLDSALEKEDAHLNPKAKTKLAENLLDRLAQAQDKGEEFNLEEEFKKEINNWVNDIPELPEVSKKKEHQQPIKNLTKQLIELQNDNLKDEYVKCGAADNIHNWLESALEKEGAHLPPKAKSKLAENLLDRLAQAQERDKLFNLEKEFNKEIKNWIDDIPDLPGVSKKQDHQQPIKKLAKKMVHLHKDDLDDNEIKKDARAEIDKWLDSTMKQENAHIATKSKAKLTDNLLDRLVDKATKLPTKHVLSKIKPEIEQSNIKPEIEQIVTEWLDNIAVLENASKKKRNKDNISDLAMKVVALRKLGVDSAELKDKIVEKIKNFLESTLENEDIRMSTKDKNTVIDNLANELVHTVKRAQVNEKKEGKEDFASLDNNFVREITDWLDDIPEVANVSKKNENKIAIKKLANEIGNKMERVDDDDVRDKVIGKIRDFLNSMLEEEGAALAAKAKNVLTNDLFNRLINLVEAVESPGYNSNSDTDEGILEWLDDALDSIEPDNYYNKGNQQIMTANIISGSKTDDLQEVTKQINEWIDKSSVLGDDKIYNQKMIEKLVKKLLPTRFEIDDEKIKRDIKNDIRKWLEEMYGKIGKQLDPKTKAKEAGKLMNIIGEAVKSKPTKAGINDPQRSKKRKQWNKPSQRSTEDELFGSEDSESNVNKGSNGETNNSSRSRPKNKESSRNRDGSGSSGSDVSKISGKSDGSRFVGKDKEAAGGSKRKRSPNNLFKNANGRGISDNKVYHVEEYNGKNNRRSSKGQRKINNSDDSPYNDRRLSKRVSKESKRSISNIIENNVDNIKSRKWDDIKKEIFKILMKNGGISQNEARKLTDNIVVKSKEVYDKKAESGEKDMIRNEVKDVLNKFGIDKNRNYLEDSITDVLTDEVVRGMLDDQTRGSMYNILTDADVGHDRAHGASIDLVERVRRISQSSTGSGKGPSVTPAQKNAFEEFAKREIENFVKENIGDVSPHTIENINKTTDGLIKDLGNIISDNNLTPQEKKDTMKNKVKDFLNKIPLQTKEPVEQLANQLINRLQNKLQTAGIFSSTPRKSSLKMFPRSFGEDTMMSSVRDDDFGNNEQRYTNQLRDTIDNWINDLPVVKEAVKDTSLRDAMVNDLANDIVDRQRYLQLNPEAKTSNEEELEHLKYQVFKWLNKVLDISDLTPYLPNIVDLMDRIKRIPVIMLVKPSSKQIQDEITKFVAQVPPNLYSTNDKAYQQQMIKELGDRILSDINKPDAAMKIDRDIAEWMPKMFNVDTPQLIRMGNTLKVILKKKGLLDNKQDGKTYKKAADILYDTVENWCDDLPIYGGNSPEEQEKIKTLKQNLASKLINKIAELNLNPEVFNDDFLYDDLLLDETDKILATVPKNPELEKYLPALKRDLISQVKEARQKIMDELAGQAYKQQLRDTVATSTCLPECLPSDEMSSFELLKDNVVDAFISLHFVPENEQEKNKYKKKISDEVIRFCNEYLRRHPMSCIDPKRLNQDLYNALKKVPVPKDESMRIEVEQLRIKDIINEWVKELPFKEESNSEVLQRNKMISVLALRLHEIEKEKESNPEFDGTGKMFEEIVKWLGKNPLKPGCEYEIPRMAERLIELLKCTEESRKFNSVFSVSGCCCTSQCVPSLPKLPKVPCSLSQSDKSHLQRIRERVRSRSPCFKDACVSPQPIDGCSQTDVSCSPPVCPNATSWNGSLCPNARQSCSQVPPAIYGTPRQSPFEISPQVIVKEYFWDSTSTTSAKPACASQGSPCKTSQGVQPCLMQRPSSPGASMRSQLYSPQTSACKCCPQQTDNQPGVRITQSCQRTPEESSGDECPAPETSRPCERDNTCSRENERTNRKSRIRDEESEWSSLRFPEDTDFWGTCRSRPRIRIPSEFEPMVRERERREENHKCRCKERVKYASCRSREARSLRERSCDEALRRRCSKCCGVNCPHPSYLYFR